MAFDGQHSVITQALMAEKDADDFYLVDPEGDITLVLTRPTKDFTFKSLDFQEPEPAPLLSFRRGQANRQHRGSQRQQWKQRNSWREIYKEPEPVDTMSESLETPLSPTDTMDTSEFDPQEYPEAERSLVRVRVSSKHLIMASGYFRRNLTSGFLESSNLSQKGYTEFRMNEVHIGSMLTIMNVIHGLHNKVPRNVKFHKLLKLAVMVDYLECNEAVRLASDWWVWLVPKAEKTVFKHSPRLVQWLCISHTFQNVMFTTLTQRAIREARGPVNTLELPIRQSVTNAIDKKRIEALRQLFSSLEDLANDFRNERTTCSFTCNAMQYGALMMELGSRGLMPPPKPPYLGYSFNEVAKSISEMEEPEFYEEQTGRDGFPMLHKCRLSNTVWSVLERVERSIHGLLLRDFQ